MTGTGTITMTRLAFKCPFCEIAYAGPHDDDTRDHIREFHLEHGEPIPGYFGGSGEFVPRSENLPKEGEQTVDPRALETLEAADCRGQKAPGLLVYRQLERNAETLRGKNIGQLLNVLVYVFNCPEAEPKQHFHVDVAAITADKLEPAQIQGCIIGLEHALASLRKRIQ